MLSNFFAQDNATAKLTTWLILAAAILSYVSHSLHLSPTIDTVLLTSAGEFTAVAVFLQKNPIIKKSSWMLFAYVVTDYLAKNQTDYPQLQQLMIALAGVLKLMTSFTITTSTSTSIDVMPMSTPILK